MGWRRAGLDALSQAALHGPNPTLVNEAIACLAPLDLKPGKALHPWSSNAYGFCFDPSFTQYATTTRDGACIVRHVSDNREVTRIDKCLRNASPKLTSGGRFLALVAENAAAVEIWALHERQPHLIFHNENHARYFVDFSTNGCWVAIGNHSNEVEVYDLDPFALRANWKLDGQLGHLAFRPDGKELAFGMPKGIELYSTESKRLVDRIDHSSSITYVAWSHDGKTIAGVDDFLNIGVWNRANKTLGTLLDGATNAGVKVAFHPTRPLLIASDWDRMRIWDWTDGKLLFSGPVPLLATQVSPDGSQIGASLENDNSVLELHFDESPVLHTLSIPMATSNDYVGQIIECPWDPLGRTWAFSTPSGTIFWNITDDLPLAKLPSPALTGCRFDSSNHLWTTGSMGIRRWKVGESQGSTEPIRLGPPQKVGWDGAALVYFPQFSADRQTMGFNIATAAFLVSTDAPTQSRVFAPTPRANFLALHESWLVTANLRRDEVTVWDLATDRPLAKLPINATAAYFSPDHRWLLTVHKTNALWRTDNWQLVRSWSPGGGPAAFCPTTSHLAISNRFGVITIVEPESGREVVQLESPASELVKAIAFSADESKLLYASGECHTVFYWDLAAIRPELEKIDLDVDPSLQGVKPVARRDEIPIQTITVDTGPEWPRRS